MANNPYDQFDKVSSTVSDLAVAFGTGSNQLLRMAGDLYGLTADDMDNAVSRQAAENIEYLQRRKSPELVEAERARKKATDSETNELDKALTFFRETIKNPLLAGTASAEAVPSLIGAGGAGAATRVAAGKLLARKGVEKAAEQATKAGVAAAVGTGAAMQGTSTAGEQYRTLVDLLNKMPDEQAAQLPQIKRLMEEKEASLSEAKAALALDLARSTGILSALTSAATQMVPGGRTIEKTLVGGPAKRVLSRATGAVKGAAGEALQEAAEEGSGTIIQNILAEPVEPGREITKGLGESVAAAAIGAGPLGAAGGAAGAGGATQSPQPAPEVETTAGKPEETPASAATRERLTERPRADLTRSEEMSPEEFWASVNVRHANLMGGQPSPEDVEVAGGIAPAGADIDTEKAKQALDVSRQALAKWKESNPSAPENIVLIYDPEMLHNGYGVQGAYNRNNGGILINTAFVAPERIGAIVNHEWAHATLATVEGQQALAKFAEDALKRVNLGELQSRYGKKDPIVLLEEWIAQNQEKAPSVIREIVARIREWLAQFNIVDLNDGEVADIMLRTLRELESNKVQPDIDVTGIETEGQTPETAYSLTKAPENLKKWAEGSVVVDDKGDPIPMYHGTLAWDFTVFRPNERGLIFGSPSPEIANSFTNTFTSVSDPDIKEAPDRARVYKIYMRAKNPFDFENPQHVDKLFGDKRHINTGEGTEVSRFNVEDGDWFDIEKLTDRIRNLGFDGLYVQEKGVKNLAVFSPEQVTSASGNVGTYGQRPVTEEEAARTGLTAEQANRAQAEGDIRFSLAQTKTPEFKEWFEDSKVVDSQNKPLRVYHGTRASFDEFRVPAMFHVSRDYAQNLGDRIVEAYLSIKNPADLRQMNLSPSDPQFAKIAKELQAQGYDGAQYRNEAYIAFSPSQIRTAETPDTRFSLSEQPIAKGRDTVLARAAQGVKAGEVTPKEYNRMVNKRMPLEPFEEVPTPATDDEVLLGLGDLMAGNRRKRDLKANPEDIEGQQVEARLDIPAYESNNVWVVTLHQPREREGAAGTVLAYTPTAVLQNVTFSVNETAALNVAGGKRKSSFATMNGEYVPMTARSAYEMANEAKDSGDWVEVGMNPIRHSYFYDKSDQRPVVSAEEVIQVGGMVLARGVEYGEKGDYKYSLQKPERPASGIMASPSITDIDYSRAKRNLTSANQARFKSQVTDYAPEATVYDAVGDWADGAENSVAAIFEGSRSTEELEELAAKAGLAGDQKAVLWWTTDPKGKDAIHRVIWPKGVSMDDARQAMIDVGLENRTLIQTPDGIQGFVFDQGQQNINKIEELHEHSTEPALESESATGDFLGSWTSRTEGRRAYRRVLGSTPQTEAGDGGQGDRVERAGGEPEAEREQPDIRYSLTGDAVGVRALEDAKTTKFKNQKGTAKYLGDLLKSEFPEGLDRMDPEAAEKLADLLDRELSLALTMPDNANAIGWYGREMEKVVEILRSPELNYELDNPVNRGVFNALLAITSNGQEVVDQFLKSAQLYEKWKKTGKIPSLGKWGGERNRAMAGQIKFLNQMLGLVGAEDTVGFLTSESSLREHLDNLYGMVAEARGLPEKATVAAKEAAIGKYLNAGMPTGELKDYNTVGAIVFGPKLGGGFFANLYGKFDRLTMDRWFMRTFHRLTGRLGFVDDRAIQGALDEARRDLGAVEYLVQTAAGVKKDAFDPVSKDRLSDSDLLAYIKSEGKKAFKNYREINAGLKENPEDASLLLQDTLRRTYNRIIKAESGLFDAPDNGSHRVFIRDVLNRVQQQRAQRGEKHIDTSDIQAILWYLEKDIWDKLKDKKEKAQDELDEQDEDDDDSAGRVSYSNGALELYRRKTGKDYVFKSGNQPERAQVLASD
ncbi:MAG: hypothetical protein RL328_771 [Acidobacteriota bacterium]